MLKPAIAFNIACKRRLKGLPLGDNPIENWSLQAFCIIRSCSGNSFLNLSKQSIQNINLGSPTAYHLSNRHDVVVRSIRKTLLKTGDHFKKCSKYAVLSPLSTRESIIRRRNLSPKIYGWSAYSVVKHSSDSSDSLPIRRRPFVSNV